MCTLYMESSLINLFIYLLTYLLTYLSDPFASLWKERTFWNLNDFLRSNLLADRTNGRAYATVLRLSSSSVTLCIVAKRCVLEQKLLLRAYRKSYMRNRLVPK